MESSSGGRIAETVAPPNIGILVDAERPRQFRARNRRGAKSPNPAYITRLGRDLLAAHFPSSLHEDICAAVGLEPDSIIRAKLVSREQRAREADFRPRIIRAYEYRCAVTGWDLRVGHIRKSGWRPLTLSGIAPAGLLWKGTVLR